MYFLYYWNSQRGSVMEIFAFLGEKCDKFQLNTFSRTWITCRMPREGNQMILSKEEQTIVSFWQLFQKNQ